MCGGRVSVAEDDVVQPVWNHALRVHEVTNRLQHRLEVVLLGLATENDVERLVDVLPVHNGNQPSYISTLIHTWKLCLSSLLFHVTSAWAWFPNSNSLRIKH